MENENKLTIEDRLDDLFMKPGKLDILQPIYFFLYRVHFHVKSFFHAIKNYYLRKRHGAGCCDVFSLDYYLARQILPGLVVFRTKVGGHPTDFITTEKWIEAIDEMIFAFDSFIRDDDPMWDEGGKEVCERRQNGFELFGKYFQSLWY